ncbi:hypothetical protein HA466_0046750 [Hirschfeldia incana]|nr:hypothetical protein HA466_0046750 [Hirschfeldia incana]
MSDYLRDKLWEDRLNPEPLAVYSINWRERENLLSFVLRQIGNTGWSCAYTRQLEAMLKLGGKLGLDQILSIQCMINAVGILHPLGREGALYNLDAANHFLTQVGTVLESECLLTYDLNSKDIKLGEGRRFKAGAVKVHRREDYPDYASFEKALGDLLLKSPVAAAMPMYDSFHTFTGTVPFHPTSDEKDKDFPLHVMLCTGKGTTVKNPTEFFEFQDSNGVQRGVDGFVRVSTRCEAISYFVEMALPETEDADRMANENFDMIFNEPIGFHSFGSISISSGQSDLIATASGGGKCTQQAETSGEETRDVTYKPDGTHVAVGIKGEPCAEVVKA